VPANLLGRVSSLDWLISIGLLPLSFALTAPVTELIGARATLIGAGVGGAAITLAALFLPGMRDVEREPEVAANVLPGYADAAVDVVVVAAVVVREPVGGRARVAAGRLHPW